MRSALIGLLLCGCATTGSSGVCPAKPVCANFLELRCTYDERSGCNDCRCVEKNVVNTRENALPPPSQPPPIR